MDHTRQAAPPPANVPIALIGGSGFVGQYLYESLIYRGDETVYLFDISEPLKHFTARHPTVKYVNVNISDPASLRKALQDHKIKIVFHTAAIITHMHHMGFQIKPSLEINYKGTLNVVEACIATGVEMLIQTSTSHVSIGYDMYHVDGDEINPGYSQKPFNHYTRSKILAEKAVINANGTIGPSGVKLRTVTVRPCSAIWGFGDRHNSDFFLGNTTHLVMNSVPIDYLYVENLSHALSKIEHALRTSPQHISGQVFCVSEDDAISGLAFKDLLRAADPTISKSTLMPPLVLWTLGMISTLNQFVFRGKISLGDLDEMTLASYHVLMAQYTFRSDKIKRVVGYTPLYTLEEGAVLTVQRRKEAAKLYGGTIPTNLPQKIKALKHALGKS